MRDGMRRSVGLALLLGILCAPPAQAQDSTAPRPWSDPPSRPAEAPAVTEAAKPASPAAEPATATPARSAAKPARSASRPRRAERPVVARRAPERRERVAARPIRPPVPRSVAEAPRRAFAVRPPPEPRPVRVARPLPPEMAGYRDVDLWVDGRADRIRRARDGGFLVMRRTTIEDPMGRRMQILRPIDDEDE
jgi:pyruvate/2-oxoglutarate dehydrogenase complex dihydrolipoamide acyltransferase (E2) component